jgi:ABC-type Na+ efflux pump permease subunit
MRARHVALVAKKELRGLGAEKTILLAVLLQVFIAVFSSFLMVGLTALYDPAALSRSVTVDYGIGYAGNDSSLQARLERSGDFQVYRMDLSTAVQALRERKLSAVLWVPDTAPGAEEPVKLTLYTLQNDLTASVLNVKLKKVLEGYEAELREVRADRLEETPIPVRAPEPRGAEFYEFVYGLLVPLLVLMPAIIAAALIIDLITEEYQQRTLETLLATPITFTEALWGKCAACMVLVPVQAGAWLVLLGLNGIRVAAPVEILLHATAASAVLILLGALVSLHYRERTSAQFVFSTALVIVMLLALAVPENPLNLIARLSVGAAGPGHWLVLAGVAALTLLLGWATTRYARSVGRAFIEG